MEQASHGTLGAVNCSLYLTSLVKELSKDISEKQSKADVKSRPFLNLRISLVKSVLKLGESEQMHSKRSLNQPAIPKVSVPSARSLCKHLCTELSPNTKLTIWQCGNGNTWALTCATESQLTTGSLRFAPEWPIPCRSKTSQRPRPWAKTCRRNARNELRHFRTFQSRTSRTSNSNFLRTSQSVWGLSISLMVWTWNILGTLNSRPITWGCQRGPKPAGHRSIAIYIAMSAKT